MKSIFQLAYVWSKKIHRWAMWFTIALSIFMGGTGIILEASIEGERAWLTSLFDLQLVRQLHGSNGKWLVLALFIMSVTGLVMWSYPLWVRRSSQNSDTNN